MAEQNASGSVVKMPARKSASNTGRKDLLRIAALERDMATMQSDMVTVKANTAQILDVLTTARTAGGYIKKYGGRAIVFGAGLFTSAGLLNPKVGQYIVAFFGG